ncbi:MAG: DUF362 domain-containing protein [Desulfatitalea sp.]|nr:DUF362 domain-containing protein [Desulfatitalea sp.]MBI5896116.1 DUF362 domain-containing protein [Desulfobacterales bacterium]
MNADSQTAHADRRWFLNRLLRASLGAAGIGALGWAFWDRRGPRPGEEIASSDLLPDFSIPDQTQRLAVVHGAERSTNVAAALAALGGMERFIQAGDRVLLKVNAAFAAPPLLGATTHPDMVTEVARRCFQAGARQVLVTDNPINDPASCFALTGIAAAAQSVGAQVILPANHRFENYSLPNGRLIRHWPLLREPLRQVNKVIGLAPVKDHHRSGASLTLKNWYGLLGGRRNIFHQEIHTIIAELALLIKPTLVILDGTVSMMRNGPTGGSLDDLKPTQTLIAGTDPVAVDAAGAALLDKTVDDLPHLRMAERLGAGTVDYRSQLVK